MRKELLLSLIAAGAVPSAALANIDVTAQTGINDAAKWQNNGLGSVAANGDLLNGGSIVVSGASAGSLSFDIDVKASKLPVGNYVINLTGENVKLTINDVETNRFTLTGAEETVAVKIAAENPGEYKVTGLTLEIDLDFATLKAKLNGLTLGEEGAKITDALEGITAVNYKDADEKPIEGRQYAEGLAEAAEAMQKKIDAMKALIAKLDNENLETYLDKDLELWTEPSKLETDLKALLAEIDAHNANVADKNTKSANWDANQKTKGEVEAALTAAKDAVDALKLAEADEFVQGQTQEALGAFNEAYNALNARLGEFDVDGEVINKAGKQTVDEEGNPVVDEEENAVWVYEPFDIDGLNTLKAAVEKAKDDAVKDAEAYTAIQGYIEEVKKEYNKHLTEFMALHVGNQSATWTQELTDIRDAAVAALGEIEKVGAAAKKAGAKQTKDDAVYDLQTKCGEVMAAAQASDNAYATLDEELKGIEEQNAKDKAAIDKLPGDELLPGAKADLLEDYADIKEALDEARKVLDGLRDEYGCVEAEGYNLAAIKTIIQTMQDQLSQVQAKVKAWQTNEDAIAKLQADLKAAQDALVEANGKLQDTLAGAGVDGVNLVAQFGEAYQGCVDAIDFSRTTNNNNLKEGKSDDIKLGYATTGVSEYVAKAAPTAEKFTAAVTAYSDLTSALNALKTQVNGAVILPGNSLDKNTYSVKWLSEDKKSGYEVSIATILDGIKTAAGNKADAIYEAIDAVVLNPDGVEEAIAADVAEFAKLLTTGNMTALNAKADEYNTAINAADAAEVFGPGLDSVKELMNTKAAVGTEGEEGYEAAVKGYTEKVSDKDAEVIAVPGTTYPVENGPKNVTEGYQAHDVSIVNLYNEMVQTVGGQMDKCKANVKAYKDYKAAYDNTIEDLAQWVKDNSNDPAQTNWLKEDNKNSGYGQIVKDKKALDDAIEAAYKANNLTDDSEKDKKDALSAAITNFKKGVTANEENHNAQLGYAEKAIADVKSAIDAVQNAGYDDGVKFKFTVDGEEVETNLEGVLAILKDLQKGLQGLHKQVSDDYAALCSKADNVYEDLVAQVQAIVDAVASDYYRAVKEANLATADAAMEGQYSGLDKKYKAAIALYNRFTAEIAGNDDYNTYVGLLAENINSAAVNLGHAELQKHYQTMRELQQRVDEILANALPEDIAEKDASKYTILTEDDFGGVTGDVANAVKAMEKYNADLTKAVNNFAKDYLYGEFGKFTAAQNEIVEAMQMMETAKMPDDLIEEAAMEAQTHVLLAQAYFAADPAEDAEAEEADNEDPGFGTSFGDMSDVKSGDVEKYFINMPAVLSELALVGIDTKTILTNFWNDSYADALETLAGYQARYDEAAKGALEADLAIPSLNLTEATAMVSQLDIWAQDFIYGMPAGMLAQKYGVSFTIETYDEDGELVSSTSYIGLIPELKLALARAEAGAVAAEAAKQKNIDNMEALAGYKADADDLKAALAEMHATIGALGLTVDEFAQIPTERADEAYNRFAGLLVDEEGNDITNALAKKTTIENWRERTKTYIERSYAKAEELEKAYLQRLLSDIQADFNTKYEAGELENANELDALIAAQRDALADANLGVELQKDEEGNEIALTPAERMAALKAIEEALFAIDLGTLEPNADATGVVKGELDLQADGVDEAIKALAEAVKELDELLDSEILAGWERTPVVGADADGMAEELAAIIAAYEADNSVETKGSYYENLLNELLRKANTGINNVDAAKAVAQAEITKREISNYWADAMDAEIAAVEAHYNNVLADIAEYKYKYYDAEWYESQIGGELETDEEGNVIGGGLIAYAKYRLAQAREEFSLNNGNTWWNEKWEAMYDENGEFVDWMLVDPQESVHTSLYNLSNIYSTVDNFALYSARTEVSGWKNEAWNEWYPVYYAINIEKNTYVDHIALKDESWRIRDVYYTISTDFTDVTEFSRNFMTAKAVIADAKALAALAQANFYKLGDVDFNGNVTGNDFVTLIDYILEKIEQPEEGTALFAAADVNTDGMIGIGDAVKVQNLINGVITSLGAPRQGAIEASASLNQGVLDLDSNFAVASMMVDLKGVSAGDLSLGNRTAGMQIMTNTLSDGTLRVVIIGADATTLSGNSGAVLYIDGEAAVENLVVADNFGNEYTVVSGGSATLIDHITDSVKAAGQNVYDLGGKLVNKLTKGVNIIRNADGTTKKVVK